jgi:uncharacterized phage-associated protein
MKIGTLVNTILFLSKKKGFFVNIPVLNKLCYFCHGHYLSIEDVPLTTSSICVGPYGPIFKKINKFYKTCGSSAIFKYMHDKDKNIYAPLIEGKDYELIESVVENYGCKNIELLSAMVHIKNGPYMLAKSYQDKHISNELMKRYFLQIRQKSKKQGPVLKVISS